MSRDRPSFGLKERRAANDAQVLNFFRGYERSWRLSKLIMIRALLQDRSSLQVDLQAGLGTGFPCDDAYIYGPLTNGLLFSAVAEVAMLTEDLLALLKFIRSREFFARSLVHYDAGAVTNLAAQVKKVPDDRLLSAFMVPTLNVIGDSSPETVAAYTKGTLALVRLARDVNAIHERYVSLYNQYKHGLTVALRPFGGNAIPSDTVARRKASLSGALVSYEARGLGKSRKGARTSVVSFMLHPETQPFLTDLLATDNLLRFAGEPRETHIETLIEDAQRLTTLVNVIVLNRVDLIAPQPGAETRNTFWLPLDDPKKPLGQLQVSVERDAGRWTLDFFQEKF